MRGLSDGEVLVLDAGDVATLGRSLERRWGSLADITPDEARRARALLHAGRHRIEALERRLATKETSRP